MKNLKVTSLLVILIFAGFGISAQSLQIENQAQTNCGCNGGTGFDQERHSSFMESYAPQVYQTNQSIPKDWASINTDNTPDNKGTEFWIAMQNNNESIPDLFVDITSDAPASGLVEIPGLGFSEPFNSTPGNIVRITLPAGCIVNGSENIENKGIHITSDVDVTVYGLNLRAFTSDAYLALPLDILNTQYIVASYPKTNRGSWGQSQFVIVSPYDNNVVTITPSASTAMGKPANTPFQVTLNAGEVYQVQGTTSAGNDLTGSLIQSTLPVAVLAGNECADIPWNSNDCCCDHIVEQLTPVSTWGNSFVTQPLETRSNGDLFRIIASGDNTEIFVNGISVATLDFAEFYEDILVDASFIESTKPVLLMQYSMSDDWDPGVNSDPFMMLIPPFEQFFNSYTFATPSSGFILNFVNLTVENEGVNFHFLDNNPVDPSNFSAIPGSNFSGTGLEIEVGTHSSNNSNESTFGLYSYGFNNFDSYGYPGGLSLEFINSGGAPVINLTAATLDLISNAQVANNELNISAIITDNEEPFVQAASLFYRQTTEIPYTEVPMTEGADNVWSGSVPAPDVMFPGVDFYISATDGQLTSTNPGVNPTNNPLVIAVDNDPPAITHTPVLVSEIGVDIPIVCDVTDDTEFVDMVELKFRKTGGNPVYETIAMSNMGGNTYETTIPGSEMTAVGLDYYIVATDNFGVSSTFGSADNPLEIIAGSSVNLPPVAVGFPLVAPIVNLGENYNLSVQFESPEEGQTTDVVVNDGGLPGFSATVTPGNVAMVDIELMGQIDNLGTHVIEFVATDDGDPVESTTVLFEITVIDPLAGHVICIPEGWSAISSYNDPFNPAMEDIFAALEAEGKVEFVLNQDGFYWPSQNINLFEGWDVKKGYKIKMNEEGCLGIQGEMPEDKSFTAIAGASFVPVLCSEPVAAIDVFSQLGDDFVFAFDIYDNLVYWPEGGLFTLNTLVPGKGYMVSMTAEGMATYNCGKAGETQANIVPAPIHDAPWTITKSGSIHLVSVNKSAFENMQKDDFLGVFNQENECAGFIRVEGNHENQLLVVYGDDLTTPKSEGMSSAEQMIFKMYRAADQQEVLVNVQFDNSFTNAGQFVENGRSMILKATEAATSISETVLNEISIQPNPSNGLFNIEIPALDENISLEVMNMSGQIIHSEVIGQNATGIQIDLSSKTKGVFFVKFTATQQTIIHKVVVQ